MASSSRATELPSDNHRGCQPHPIHTFSTCATPSCPRYPCKTESDGNVGRGPTMEIPFVKTKKRACVGISCGRLRLMRTLKARSDLIRAHLGDKRTVGVERFSTIKSHQFQLAPITKIIPLGPVSQWDDSSQMGPSTKGPAIRVDLAIIQATKTTSWLLREIRSSHE